MLLYKDLFHAVLMMISRCNIYDIIQPKSGGPGLSVVVELGQNERVEG